MTHHVIAIWVSGYLVSKSWQWSLSPFVSTSRPEQNGLHLADDIFKCIFLNGNYDILVQDSIKFSSSSIKLSNITMVKLRFGVAQSHNDHGIESLQWRHNGRDGISNHQPHHWLLNSLFRRRSKKTSKLRVTGICGGIHRGPVNPPHKWPVTRKMFPLDDVIMIVYPGLFRIQHYQKGLSSTLNVKDLYLHTHAIFSTNVSQDGITLCDLYITINVIR